MVGRPGRSKPTTYARSASPIQARISSAMMSTSKNPLGLEDLFNLQLRPTRRFVEDKRDIYLERVASKDWVNIGPLLKQD